eukprot:4684568-Pyramimonas_sp.AAC.1
MTVQPKVPLVAFMLRNNINNACRYTTRLEIYLAGAAEKNSKETYEKSKRNVRPPGPRRRRLA